MRIQSLKDPLLRRIRLLSRPVGRRQLEQYVVEGERLTRRALEQGVAEVVIVSTDAPELRALAAERRVPVAEVGAGLLSRAMAVKVAPRALAVVPERPAVLPELLARQGVLLVCEAIKSADNLGMMLRSAEGLGVDGVVLAGECADPLSRRSIRAGRGAHFSLPVVEHPEPIAVLRQARERGHRIIATSARGGVPYTAVDYTGPTLLVTGNESTGISEPVRSLAEAVVSIPMVGRMACLNLTVAASVVMVEAIRQRAEARKA